MASRKGPISAKSETGSRLHKCEVCGKNFPFKVVLDMHKKDHIFKNVFKCPKCESSYPKRSQLEMHLRKHTGEKPFKCADCGSAFINSSNLRRHKRKHLCRRSYDKDEWEAAFALSGSLHNEKQSAASPSSGNKLLSSSSTPPPLDNKLSCQECGEVFTCLLDVIVHKKKHSEVPQKPFACDLCHLTFSVKASLNYHNLKHSGTDTNFWHNFCEICEEAFTSKDGLIQHQRKHHHVTQTFTYDKNQSAFSAPIQSPQSNLNIVYPNVSHEMYSSLPNEHLQQGLEQNHLTPQFDMHNSLMPASGSPFSKNASDISHFQQVSFASPNLPPLLPLYSEGGTNLHSTLAQNHVSSSYLNPAHLFHNNLCLPSSSEAVFNNNKTARNTGNLPTEKQTESGLLQSQSISLNVNNKCLSKDSLCALSSRETSSIYCDYIGKSDSKVIKAFTAADSNAGKQDDVTAPNLCSPLPESEVIVKDLSVKK